MHTAVNKIRGITLTFLYVGLFDAAADQRVISCLVPYDVQQSGHVSRVSKGDFGDQRSLQRFPILHWGISIQKVAVLLSWQRLDKITSTVKHCKVHRSVVLQKIK